MKIVDKKLSEIRPYENNPRNNERAVEPVMNSIKEFGFKQPIVIDTDGTIIVGHTRFEAAKRLGLETVPCLVANDLTPAQIQAYRLVDNKTNEFADWDFEKLSEELDGLSVDFDMSEFGFEDFNLDETLKESNSDIFDRVLGVFITCEDEEEQESVYNQIMEGGYNCRLLTL